MSLRDSALVLDARTLGTADADRVARWQGARPDGWVWVGNSHTGQDPRDPTWFDASRMAALWAWRSASMRVGVDLRSLWQWRPDVIGAHRIEAWARDPRVCRTSMTDYRDALLPWTAARWGWGLADSVNGPWWASLPEKRAVYATADPAARTLAIVGVLADMEYARGELFDSALRWHYATGCTGLLVDVKPWERAGQPVATPANPTGGPIQPTSYLRGEWEAQISDVLRDVGAEMPVVTLTRMPTPPLWQLIGDASASKAVVGEAALRPATEAL